MSVAALIDFRFFLHKFNEKFPKYRLKSTNDNEKISKNEDDIIDTFANIIVGSIYVTVNRAIEYLAEKDKLSDNKELYRIFVYDCPPLLKKGHKKISKKAIDFSKSVHSELTNKIHYKLKKGRKVALRLGRLSDYGDDMWKIKPDVVKNKIKTEGSFKDLEDEDFVLSITQKGVDMRIGLDISSLAFKKQVSRIILFSGDSDFVPAAKLARREGLDFVLASLGHKINDDLDEHIDGLFTASPVLYKKHTDT